MTSVLNPRSLRGAIVALDLKTSKQTTIIFQYYPNGGNLLSRQLNPAQSGGNDNNYRQVASYYTGAPTETIDVSVSIDATDALVTGDTSASTLGIYPQLCALEMLVYPQSQQVMEYDKLLAKGQMETGGNYSAPLTLLVWGQQRVLPVQLTSLDIRESVFDTQLNPIQVEVGLKMKTLSYSDLAPSHKGYSLFVAYQKNKERQATQGATSGNMNDILGVDVTSRLR